jgi:hypothetical protein
MRKLVDLLGPAGRRRLAAAGGAEGPADATEGISEL